MISPPLIPSPGFDTSVLIVMDDLGRLGRVYREAAEHEADRDTVMGNMIGGQYEHPVRVVEFNTAEGWARDVSEDIAREVLERATRENVKLARGILSEVRFL